MYGLGQDKCPGRRRRHPPDAPSGAFTSTGRSAIQKGAGLERVLGRPVTTSVRPTVRTAAPRSSATTEQEPHADRRRQGTRRRTPLGRDLLEHQGRAALPPRHRRGHPATDPDELRYTLESRLHVLPSFATVAGNGSPGVISGLSMPGVEVDLARVLHGGQSLRLHRPIPARSTATSTGHIAAVYDKGKAAVLVMRTEVADAGARSGPTTRRSSYGERAAGAATEAPPPASTPNGRAPQGGRASRPRGPGPPLPPLRRLEPLHADPEFAKLVASTGPSCTACAPTA